MLYHAPVTGGNVLIEEYEKGALRADFRCRNTGDQEGYVELPLLHYYGYRAYAGGVQLPVCKGDNNVVRVIIPAGFEGEVTAGFVSPWYWRVAEAVSYMMLLSLLVVYIIHRKEKKKCGNL